MITLMLIGYAIKLARGRPVAINWYWLAVVVIVGAGVVARFAGLSAHYLSYDESFTALIVRRPLADLITATAGDVHPPLGYVLLWAFVRVAGAVTPLTLRVVPAVLGSLAIVQVHQLARRLQLAPAAHLAGLALFALAPFEIHYSQDARMYALLQLAVLGAVLALLARRWWWLGLWLTVALWTHNYGLMYLAGLGLLGLALELRRPVRVAGAPAPEAVADVRGLVLAFAVPVALWAPWLAVLLWQMRALAAGYWIAPLTLGQFIAPAYTLLWGIAMPGALQEYAVVVGYGLLAFAGLKALRLKTHRRIVWLIVAPALLGAVVSLVWRPVYLYRALLGVVGPGALLVGWALTHNVSRPRRWWAALVLVPLLVAGLSNRRPALAIATGENNRAMEVVAAGYQPGDIVYHGNVGSLSGFLAAGPAELDNYLMTVQPGSVGVLTPQTRRALGLCEGALEPGAVVTTCGRASWRRAWLVWGASQTISGVEDTAIAELLARYPHIKVLDIHDAYHGPQPVEGGIWLLTAQ